jgi:hypothetical protein
MTLSGNLMIKYRHILPFFFLSTLAWTMDNDGAIPKADNKIHSQGIENCELNFNAVQNFFQTTLNSYLQADPASLMTYSPKFLRAAGGFIKVAQYCAKATQFELKRIEPVVITDDETIDRSLDAAKKMMNFAYSALVTIQNNVVLSSAIQPGTLTQVHQNAQADYVNAFNKLKQIDDQRNVYHQRYYPQNINSTPQVNQAMNNSTGTQQYDTEHPDGYGGDEEYNINQINECFGALETNQVDEAYMFSNFFKLDHAKKLKNNLIHTTCLKSLTLEGSQFHNRDGDGLGDGVLGELCFGLKANTTLTCLNLSNNNISGHEVKGLIESIVHNSSLNRLVLAQNIGLGDDGHGAAALSSLLKNNSVLTELDLSWCPLDSGSIKTICTGIKENKTLQRFAFNSKHVACLGDVAEVLQTHPCLADLRIDYRVQDPTSFAEENHTKDKGAVVLAQVLATNTSLQRLSITNLQANWLTEFSQALNTNTVLKRFFIEHHNLTKENLDALATAISRNSTIEEMTIFITNPFGEKEADEASALLWEGVLNALKKNTTLTYFNVAYGRKAFFFKIQMPVYPKCVEKQIDQQRLLNRRLENVKDIISYQPKILEIYVCCSTIPNELIELLVVHLILIAKKSPVPEWPHF